MSSNDLQKNKAEAVGLLLLAFMVLFQDNIGNDRVVV
jgi:hypothetical protein